jgi:hypothetical protein
LRLVCSSRLPSVASRTQVVPWDEQTSTQSLLLAADFPRELSNAMETVGINAFSKIAKMAIQLEMTRRGRIGMGEAVGNL